MSPRDERGVPREPAQPDPLLNQGRVRGWAAWLAAAAAVIIVVVVLYGVTAANAG